MIIEYPISENYVKNWGVWEAVREFLQNAMDSGDCDVAWFNGMIRISNVGCVDKSMMLLGNSDKAGDARGQFGEGMKLAMLVMARMGRKMEMRSGGKQWIPELTHSDVFGEKIFKIRVEEMMTSGVEVDVEVTESEWLEIENKRLCIPDEYGILEGKRAGLIFVGGLYVCTLKKFDYAFNFKPSDIELNRDRDIPSMFSVQNAAMKYMDDHQMLAAAMDGSGMVNEYFSRKEGMAKVFAENYGEDCVPVGVSEQGSIVADNMKVVPDWVAKQIRSCSGVVVKRVGSPLDRLEKWIIESSACSWASDIDWTVIRGIIEELKRG